MSENLHDIEDLFHDPIEGYQEMPPESVWDNIDHKLDKGIVASTNKKYSRLKRLSAVLLFFSLGTITYEVLTKAVHPVNQKYIGIFDKNKVDRAMPAASTKPGLLKNDKTKEPINSPNAIPKNSQAKLSSGSENTVVPLGANDDHRLVYTVNHARLDRKKLSLPSSVINKTDAPDNNPVKEDYVLAAEGEIGNRDNNNLSKKQTIKNISSASDNSQPGSMELVRSGVNTKGNKKVQPVSETVQSVSDKAVVEETHTIAEHTIEIGAVSIKTERNPELSRLVTVPAVTHFNVRFDVTMNEVGKGSISSDSRIAPISVTKKQGHFHFALTPFFSPQFNFNHIVDDDDHPVNGQRHNYLNDIKNSENDKTSYSLGVLMEMPLKKRWFLQTGLAYINKTLEMKPKKIYADLENGAVKYRFDFSSGYTYLFPKTGRAAAVGDSALATESSSNLQYIGIPLTINYTFLTGKFNIIPSIGAGVNFLISEKVQTNVLTGTSTSQQRITSIEGIKKVYLNTISGIMFQYNAGKKIAVNITPSANFALGPINRNTGIKSYPNSFNITAGVKIYF